MDLQLKIILITVLLIGLMVLVEYLVYVKKIKYNIRVAGGMIIALSIIVHIIWGIIRLCMI